MALRVVGHHQHPVAGQVCPVQRLRVLVRFAERHQHKHRHPAQRPAPAIRRSSRVPYEPGLGWTMRSDTLSRDAEAQFLAPLRTHNWTVAVERDERGGEYAEDNTSP